jgi:cytochrome c biogenesis protein CcmG/thiol:disulfide interchange protein DsbE
MTTRRHLLQRAAVGTAAFAALPPFAGLVGCESTPEPTPEPEAAHPLEGLTDWSGAAYAVPPILGEVTLIDFWASWCAPCRQGFPYLDQLYRTWSSRGLRMVAVSCDEDTAAARRFVAWLRPRFPIAWDPKSSVRNRFGVGSLPTTYLLDQNGALVHRNLGFDLVDHRLLEEQVRRLLSR